VHEAVQLTSIDTEAYLTKFVVDKGANLQLAVQLHLDDAFWDVGKHTLEIDVFNEKGFETFRTLLEKGSLCDQRLKHAHKRYAVTRKPATRLQVQLGYGVSDAWRNEGPSQVFYIYATDCALEFYNAKSVPSVKYDLEIQTEHLGHLPSDEWGLLTFNFFFFLALSGLFAMLLLRCKELYRKHKQVHIFVLVVAGAYALQIVSLFCEMCHLIVYNWNGKGLRWRHTFFALDFVAEIAQGTSEHLVALLLIFLACGWTTTNLHDFVQSVSTTTAAAIAANGGSGIGPVSSGGGSQDPTLVQVGLRVLAKALQHPKVNKMARTLTKQLRSPAQSIFRKVSLGGLFVAWLTALHLALEMLGRQYHDEFSQFHDHEHWPGRCILFLRLVLWCMFVTGAYMTYSSCKKQTDLRKSMLNLALFGSIWLLAFPVSVLFADMLAPRFRHRVVYIGSVLLQTVALHYLVYLGLFSKTFTKVSSIANPSKASTLPSEGLVSVQSNPAETKQATRRRKLKVAYD